MSREKEVNFRERRLVFVDIETTGLDPEKHEIIEIGCLVVDGESFKVLQEYVRKIKPLHIEKADPEALSINGYNEDGWRDAENLGEVLGEFASLAPGGIIIGWNVSFDWQFLSVNFERLGIIHTFDYHRLDVMSIAYAKLYPVTEVKKLGTRPVAKYFGIKMPEVHDALGDIRASYEIFKILMKKDE